MKVSLVQQEPTRVFAVVLDTGDEVIDSITSFAARHNVTAAHFTAIGAFQRATLAWFDMETKDYEHIPIDEQVEVVSLVGNIAMYDGRPRVHAHAAVGKRYGGTIAGHIVEAYVRPTLEMFVTEVPGQLVRKIDEETGLPLISLVASTDADKKLKTDD